MIHIIIIFPKQFLRKSYEKIFLKKYFYNSREGGGIMNLKNDSYNYHFSETILKKIL